MKKETKEVHKLESALPEWAVEVVFDLVHIWKTIPSSLRAAKALLVFIANAPEGVESVRLKSLPDTQTLTLQYREGREEYSVLFTDKGESKYL